MSWTYSGNPSSSTLDEVRFLCGDTDTTNQLITNEEITYLITQYPDATTAAAMALDALASKYSRMADKQVGDLRIQYSQIAQGFRAQADRMIQNMSTSAMAYFGGNALSEKETLFNDSTITQPFFSRDMWGGDSGVGI